MSDAQLQTLMAENVSPRTGRSGWHGGPTVVGALRGVTAREAIWRPSPDRHSIWELALHIAYWHHTIARRLRGGRRGPLPHGLANWPAIPASADAVAWKRDRALIRAAHLEVAATIRAVRPAAYARRAPGSRKWTIGELILGAAQHEAYHTGQIQLMKRLLRRG